MKNDGGSAFPQSCNGQIVSGMSLRDYFAGQALVGLMGNIERYSTGGRSKSELREFVANAVYLIADAMITERNKGAN